MPSSSLPIALSTFRQCCLGINSLPEERKPKVFSPSTHNTIEFFSRHVPKSKLSFHILHWGNSREMRYSRETFSHSALYAKIFIPPYYIIFPIYSSLLEVTVKVHSELTAKSKVTRLKHGDISRTIFSRCNGAREYSENISTAKFITFTVYT